MTNNHPEEDSAVPEDESVNARAVAEVGTFQRRLRLVADDTIPRILRGFRGIEAEAREAGEAERDLWGDGEALTLHGFDDGFVESMAGELEELRLRDLDALLQGALNLLAVNLYHLFEQQWARLAREFAGVVPPPEKMRLECGRRTRGDMRLGLLCEAWERTETLRLAANAIKHGEGDSEARLRTKKTDLFIPPDARSERFLPPKSVGEFEPLSGEGLFVSAVHLVEFGADVQEAWNLVLDALRCREHS